jgi:hypothetical protein
MNVPCDDVTKSASNEESVTGTTSKDDAENSKTSGSNVEDAALPSQKGESEEGNCPFPWTSGGARAAPLCREIHDFLFSLHCSLSLYMKFQFYGIVSQRFSGIN